jgi:serine/threonine protein kinase
LGITLVAYSHAAKTLSARNIIAKVRVRVHKKQMTKDSEPDSWIGRTLRNQYRIIEELGKGGFGKTYRAEDLRMFKSPCVVKRLLFHGSYPDNSKPLRERFELEARTLTELGKDEQLPVLYAYEPNDYLVQEFIVGKTLEKSIPDGGLPEERVRSILISLLRVLDLVHSKRKIHRDVKPANIILREKDNLPVLIDFGAVKELTTTNLQFPTMPLGTLGYSVPEEWFGTPDYFFDLYSLGATALFMLTGKEPQLLNAPRRGDGGWRKYASNVSDGLASIINKAMLSGPERYSTASEMREDLLSSMDGDPTQPLGRGAPLVDMATGQLVVEIKQPADFPLPPEHLYLAEGRHIGEHILYRKKDGQVVLCLPKDGKASNPFVIDQHLITNNQFALFINDPKVSPHVQLTRLNDVLVATSTDGSLLVADARSFWKRNGSELLDKPTGLVHSHEGWTPLAGSEHLPVVLVSVLGGSWYAAWLKDLPVEEARIGFGLPSESQWIRASLLDQNTGVQRRFPWGNSWDRQRLNSLSYWANRDLREVEINVRSEATLTPVGQFPEGASASGLMDAFGNAWEWLKESDGSGGYMIRGGAFTSPTSVFDTAVMYRQNDFVSQAIGFRCAWQA